MMCFEHLKHFIKPRMNSTYRLGNEKLTS